MGWVQGRAWRPWFGLYGIARCMGCIAEYVNPDLLAQDWPKIRRLTARQLVRLWEQRLPQLAAA
ncbi:hypothetical protein Adu01nite_78280 [Paractinoplanes durhamensis]|uniref:Uncharacterized protein n=1 Tax=Paractinoplanes durhamensis TaxID=113563 RepID=A0ABQ3Z9G4_9ACTN|nr:hypothetical protein Adu01nite_78280 [Actinoplanes durhamensis]